MPQQRFKGVDYESNWLQLKWSKKVKNELVSEDKIRSELFKDFQIKECVFEGKTTLYIDCGSIEEAKKIQTSLSNGTIRIDNHNKFYFRWADLNKKESKQCDSNQNEISMNCFQYADLSITQYESIKNSVLSCVMDRELEKWKLYQISKEDILYHSVSDVFNSSFDVLFLYELNDDTSSREKPVFFNHSHSGSVYKVIYIQNKENKEEEKLNPSLDQSKSPSVTLSFTCSDGRKNSVLLTHQQILTVSQDARFDASFRTGYASSDSRDYIIFLMSPYMCPCPCMYPDQCDEKIVEEAANNKPTSMETNFVHDVYDMIAPHFSSTRFSHWPGVISFLNSFNQGSVLLDVGCGNGKYIGCGEGIYIEGCDRSIGLLRMCRELQKNNVVLCDILNLPYRPKSYDGAISIAVIHHLSSSGHRLRAIQNIVNILKIGGRALIYVWALEQEAGMRRQFDKQDVMVDWHLQNKYFDKDKNIVDDIEESKEKQAVVYKRFYHVFNDGELEFLCNKISNIKINNLYFEHANWCIEIERISE
ncbi:hypothetical protein WA158_000480 [Blastocystis sp. Blastoise]